MYYNFRNDAHRWQMSKSINSIFTCLSFAKIRRVRMKVTGIHTIRETNKAMANVAIFEIADLTSK